MWTRSWLSKFSGIPQLDGNIPGVPAQLAPMRDSNRRVEKGKGYSFSEGCAG